EGSSWKRGGGGRGERLRRLDSDAEGRNSGAAVAPTRPRYGADATFRMRDQKPDRAHLLRQLKLDAAVHVSGRERIFVADHDDPAANAIRVPLEIVTSTQTEIEGLGPPPRGPMPSPEGACMGTNPPSWRWSFAPPAPATLDSPGDRRNPPRRARPRAAPGRRPAPRLRSPSRRRGRPDRTATGSPPTLPGRWDLLAARADAPSMRRPSRDADPDRLDDFGPAGRVGLDQRLELRGGGMGRRDAQRLKARRKLVRVENGFEVAPQACGNLRR